MSYMVLCYTPWKTGDIEQAIDEASATGGTGAAMAVLAVQSSAIGAELYAATFRQADILTDALAGRIDPVERRAAAEAGADGLAAVSELHETLRAALAAMAQAVAASDDGRGDPARGALRPAMQDLLAVFVLTLVALLASVLGLLAS